MKFSAMKPQKCLSDKSRRYFTIDYRDFAILLFMATTTSILHSVLLLLEFFQISLDPLLSNFATATSGSAKRENGDKNGFQTSTLAG